MRTLIPVWTFLDLDGIFDLWSPLIKQLSIDIKVDNLIKPNGPGLVGVHADLLLPVYRTLQRRPRRSGKV